MKSLRASILDLFTQKTILPILTLLVLGAACMMPTLAAAEVFLQGNYVQVGIHNAGSFGTAGPQPAGFYSNMSNGTLGFIADYGKDGWMVGTPRIAGDYFLPGVPEEGWMVEWNNPAGKEASFHNFGRMNNEFDVPMSDLFSSPLPGSDQAIWQGTARSGAGALAITQTVKVNANDLFFVMNVTMTNVGTETLRSLEYMRTLDPDQESLWEGGATTRNWVEFQPPRPSSAYRVQLFARPAGNINKALVIAQGLEYGMTLGLGTIDSRAVVGVGDRLSMRDTDVILNNPTQPLLSSPYVADVAISLAYDLGDLAPGQSVSIDYAYILNSADLDVAMDNLAAVTILQPTGTVSGDSVIFQANTNNTPKTSKIEFYVNGDLIDTDSSPSESGVYEATFDSMPLDNGPVVLKAVATFAGGATVEKSTTITVENSGPPISFSTPNAGDIFSGSNIPVEINIDNPSQPPVRVSFFRESATGGSVFLGEDTSSPFTALFDVTDLPAGETVVIKAVANDAYNKSTTIQTSGSTPAAPTITRGVVTDRFLTMPEGHKKLLNSHHFRTDRR